MMEEPDSLLAQRWTNLESLGLDHAVTILEFLSKTGQVALLTEGYARIADRADSVLQSDLRFARLKIVEARLSFWMPKWEETAFNLQRIIELICVDGVLIEIGNIGCRQSRGYRKQELQLPPATRHAAVMTRVRG